MKHGEKMTCERCGKEIIRHNWQQRYCADCSIVVNREAALLRVNNERIRLGVPMKCEICGRRIRRRNWQQRYCEDCADKIHSRKIPRPKRAKK